MEVRAEFSPRTRLLVRAGKGPGCCDHGPDGFEVDTDKDRLNVDVIHAYLRGAYWCVDIPREVVVQAIRGSMCFGAYDPRGVQVGFARVITDAATFAYLADVFVLEEFRGRGLSKFLMHVVLDHPELQSLRRFMLLTRDAHGLYRQFGFEVTSTPYRVMEKREPDVYVRMSQRADTLRP